MIYKPVIGLEIHIQAKTKSKMFSSVSADYWGKPPNSCVDPVTLGLPGALPVPNKLAIEKCIKLSQALNCEINKETKFDRKNYFYPDLPKGYQISQYDKPIGKEGEVEVEVNGKLKSFGITRVHMEEDTGKSIHEGNRTLVDFNKAGVPLIEVVTEPDFTDGEEIDAFAKSLRQIVRYLDVSDGDMEKGQMRYELNISLRKVGEKNLPDYKVEVKNIGSISLLQKVLEYEVKRQSEILKKGDTPVQETRGAKDATGKTFSQRVKENADDYRYFPEPDIPPIEFSDEYLEEIRSEIPKLPQQLYDEYKELGINPEIADIISAEKDKSDLLELIRDQSDDDEITVAFANLIAGQFTALIEEEITQWEILSNKVDQFIFVLKLKNEDKINSSTLSELVEKIAKSKFKDTAEIDNYVSEEGLEQKSSAEELRPIVEKVIAAEPDAKERYADNPNVVMYFVGQVMKATQGAADPNKVKEIAEDILQG